jgi:hypothetical protein
MAATSCLPAAEPLRVFKFDAHIEPAFLQPADLAVRSTGQAAEFTIKIANSPKPVTVPVDNEVARAFHRDATRITPVAAKEVLGVDGCIVKMRLTVEGKDVVTSSVWSPNKETSPTEYALLEALYEVVDKSRVPSAESAYLELLFGYFDGIQPRWKVLAGNPSTVRLYARMSSHDIPAFRDLIVSLPKDRDTVIDVTNLLSTGTLLEDEFRKATLERPIRWRAGKGWAEELAKIGIPQNRIIPRMGDAEPP